MEVCGDLWRSVEICGGVAHLGDVIEDASSEGARSRVLRGVREEIEHAAVLGAHARRPAAVD